MKLFFIFVVTLAIVHSLHIHSHLNNKQSISTVPVSDPLPETQIMVGGFSDYPITNLDSDHKEIDTFIRKNVPMVANWTLVHISQQVVAGMNYCYTYQKDITDKSGQNGNSEEICVWSQPWEDNFLQLTTPNGKVITQTTTPKGKTITSIINPSLS